MSSALPVPARLAPVLDRDLHADHAVLDAVSAGRSLEPSALPDIVARPRRPYPELVVIPASPGRVVPAEDPVPFPVQLQHHFRNADRESQQRVIGALVMRLLERHAKPVHRLGASQRRASPLRGISVHLRRQRPDIRLVGHQRQGIHRVRHPVVVAVRRHRRRPNILFRSPGEPGLHDPAAPDALPSLRKVVHQPVRRPLVLVRPEVRLRKGQLPVAEHSPVRHAVHIPVHHQHRRPEVHPQPLQLRQLPVRHGYPAPVVPALGRQIPGRLIPLPGRFLKSMPVDEVVIYHMVVFPVQPAVRPQALYLVMILMAGQPGYVVPQELRPSRHPLVPIEHPEGPPAARPVFPLPRPSVIKPQLRVLDLPHVLVFHRRQIRLLDIIQIHDGKRSSSRELIFLSREAPARHQRLVLIRRVRRHLSPMLRPLIPEYLQIVPHPEPVVHEPEPLRQLEFPYDLLLLSRTHQTRQRGIRPVRATHPVHAKNIRHHQDLHRHPHHRPAPVR